MLIPVLRTLVTIPNTGDWCIHLVAKHKQVISNTRHLLNSGKTGKLNVKNKQQ